MDEALSPLFERNLSALSQGFPDLVPWLREETPSDRIRVLWARTGLPVLQIGGITFHSLVDPEKEAARWAAAGRTAETQAGSKEVAVFGFGLGYHVKALLKAGCRRVTVLEPDLGVLRIAFQHLDFSSALEMISWRIGSRQILEGTTLPLRPFPPAVRLHRGLFAQVKASRQRPLPARETIAELAAAVEAETGFGDFLKRLPPREEAVLDRLLEKLDRSKDVLPGWQTLLLLIKAMEEPAAEKRVER